MAGDRDLLFNFERMRREMDELFGDVWGGVSGARRRTPSGFSPRVDVYYCGREEPMAIVKADVSGVRLESLNLEIAGRELVISGERPVQETEGRVYQQVEIQSGPFRRAVRLNADVEADRARATYDDGILRVELPLRTGSGEARQVPIVGPGGDDDG
jgi:HSP20 family protein